MTSYDYETTYNLVNELETSIMAVLFVLAINVAVATATTTLITVQTGSDVHFESQCHPLKTRETEMWQRYVCGIDQRNNMVRRFDDGTIMKDDSIRIVVYDNTTCSITLKNTTVKDNDCYRHIITTQGYAVIADYKLRVIGKLDLT